MLNQEKVKKLFIYQEDGSLLRRESRGRIHAGYVAGCVDSSGYLQIGIEGKAFLAHRLVWLYHHGYWPENQVDHIDRDKLNNMIDNLREVSQSCNLRNTGNRSTNTSGVKGVHWSSGRRKWKVQISVSGSLVYLGIYQDFTEAVAHRLAAEQSLDWSGCDSSSPAFQYMQKYLSR